MSPPAEATAGRHVPQMRVVYLDADAPRRQELLLLAQRASRLQQQVEILVEPAHADVVDDVLGAGCDALLVDAETAAAVGQTTMRQLRRRIGEKAPIVVVADAEQTDDTDADATMLRPLDAHRLAGIWRYCVTRDAQFLERRPASLPPLPLSLSIPQAQQPALTSPTPAVLGRSPPLSAMSSPSCSLAPLPRPGGRCASCPAAHRHDRDQDHGNNLLHYCTMIDDNDEQTLCRQQ